MLPFDLTPHEVASALVDKVLLGGVALCFGYWLNRRMEEFRSRRAAEAEFLRERTKRLDEVFELMLQVQAASENYISLKKFIAGWVTTSRAEGLELEKKTNPEIRSRFQEQIDATHKLSRRAASVRPWIGDALTAACSEFQVAVAQTMNEHAFPDKLPDSEKLEELTKRTMDLLAQIVAEIRRDAPAPPAPKQKKGV